MAVDGTFAQIFHRIALLPRAPTYPNSEPPQSRYAAPRLTGSTTRRV